MNGGELIGRFLKEQNISFLFTLCGGHISPILAGCKQQGIRVIDTRHEATAVFAADAVARLTGKPGVAAVTAGPGVTNTLTAIQNAFLAQSPLILLGGAVATVLKGRGALQDIDQISLLKPAVKRAISVRRVKQIIPALEDAFQTAQSGVPGPVFVELPVDLLYDESLVRDWYLGRSGRAKSWQGKLQQWYLNRHLNRILTNKQPSEIREIQSQPFAAPPSARIKKIGRFLKNSHKPLLLLGSQATLQPEQLPALVKAIEKLGIPVYLSGMARGLLGRNHSLHIRHQRRQALKEADLIILAGVPCDFRLDYGRHIPRLAVHIAINRSKKDLTLNKRPVLSILADPAQTLIELASNHISETAEWQTWIRQLQERDQRREQEIQHMAQQKTAGVNPLYLLQQLEQQMAEDSILIGDGGDFVASASYILCPRLPLSWLDPGVFGTLGVGAGFALGAKLVHPKSEVWIIYGDGAAAYSLMEFDTFVRHNLPIIAIIGNDGGWTQIAREQVEILKDDVGTVLRQADYHQVAIGMGAAGKRLENPADIVRTIAEAQESVHHGKPFLINAIIGKTEFRKGSISM